MREHMRLKYAPSADWLVRSAAAANLKTKRCANQAAQALRLAAAALRTSQSALGAYFRRMCARMDKPKAITAAAHKLARLIYTMLTKGVA